MPLKPQYLWKFRKYGLVGVQAMMDGALGETDIMILSPGEYIA